MSLNSERRNRASPNTLAAQRRQEQAEVRARWARWSKAIDDQDAVETAAAEQDLRVHGDWGKGDHGDALR